jgi:hypothetical protein
VICRSCKQINSHVNRFLSYVNIVVVVFVVEKTPSKFPHVLKTPRILQEGGDELERLQQEAERILAEARAEAQKLIADARAAGLEASNKEVAKVKEVCPFLEIPFLVSGCAFRKLPNKTEVYVFPVSEARPSCARRSLWEVKRKGVYCVCVCGRARVC